MPCKAAHNILISLPNYPLCKTKRPDLFIELICLKLRTE